MKLTLSQLASTLDVELSGKDSSFSQVSINTRTMTKGDLFVAIKGDNFDAHNYLEQAIDNGACGVLVEKSVEKNNTLIKSREVAHLQVANTRIALGQIAALWRNCLSLSVVAVTGSCGKTTVKEMTNAILSHAKESVLATQGNLNNDIGVPLTLMQLNETHQMAIIEIGANHAGEINQLVDYVKPDIALITNAAHAHIEGFGSLEQVAQAKAEIYNGLKQKGIAIINADDSFADYWLNHCQTTLQQKSLKCVTFAVDKPADISVTYQAVEKGTELAINTPQGNINCVLPQYGKHNVYNALASVAIALSAGCSLSQIKFSLERFTNIFGRLEQKQGINNAAIFDDSYNANPGSVRAGVDAIQQFSAESVLILGDMAELGEQSKELHYQLGIDIAKMGLKKLVTLGKDSNETCNGFNSINHHKAQHFVHKDALLDYFQDYLQHSAEHKQTVLIKGSRSMAMENIVNALLVNNKLIQDIQ